ncbi:radical SAM protein [Streptomyces sp. NPDC051642]|uniref:radical SAM protein n=1 Tax=Streptomyces sp. NPDC051642 TaxID=3154646 RepID=UPI003437166B
MPDLDRIEVAYPDTPRILSICFEPTNQCPGRCPYCLIEDHDGDHPTTTLRLVIDRMLSLGTVRFGFGGGEPLIRGDVFQLGAQVRERGGGALLRTSGMFRLEVQETNDSFDWVDLSLDSSDRDVFRRCRPGVPFEVLTDNIDRLADGAVRTRVSILLTSRNVRTVEQTVTWLAEHGVTDVRLQRLVPRGKARVTWNKLKLPGAVEDNVMDEMSHLGRVLGIRVRELRTVSEATLCIVKGDGALYSGEPTGIRHRGSVFRDADVTTVADLLFDAQMKAYCVGH